jgi:hypothetical protein
MSEPRGAELFDTRLGRPQAAIALGFECETWRSGLAVADVVGHSLLSPRDDDVAAAMDTVVDLYPSTRGTS